MPRYPQRKYTFALAMCISTEYRVPSCSQKFTWDGWNYVWRNVDHSKTGIAREACGKAKTARKKNAHSVSQTK
ncbi:hypothetical protein LMH87_003680 [Akanthomyces muscarius]|uniref:Uncharacterized protein n=1 Tax=Akanthomyces muscarius TaxID=2231603 RepID=A0A9W8UH62_AKAMU|nr:hypothetical protein LMH87_003680 [Akanthomyces muscarius]KAJ4144810.1 hypothetical protein LMH87_003680 [Akanthomyces muscarius]